MKERVWNELEKEKEEQIEIGVGYVWWRKKKCMDEIKKGKII